MLFNRQRAFTILELLVVTGIITILASILFPTFASARERGKQVGCSANLHQLHMAMMLYASDANGFVPCYTTSEAFHSSALGQAMPTQSDDPLKLTKSLQPYGVAPSQWYCPSDAYAGSNAYYIGIIHRYTSYLAITFSPTDKQIPHLSCDTQDPSKFLIGDAVDSKGQSDDALAGLPPWPVMSNHGKSVTLYADCSGAIRRKRPTELVPTANSRSAQLHPNQAHRAVPR